MRKYLRPEDGIRPVKEISTINDIVQGIARKRNTAPANDSNQFASEILRLFGKHPLIGRFGERDVIFRIDRAMELLFTECRYLLRDVVPPWLRPEIAWHNDVADCYHLPTLMSYVIPDERNRGEQGRVDVERVRSKHARKRIIFGTLGFLIEAVDDPRWLDIDLQEATASLPYVHAPLHKLRIVVPMDAKKRQLVFGHMRVFTSEEEEQQYKTWIVQGKNIPFSRSFMCREVSVDGNIMMIQTNRRAKSPLATVIKLIRNFEKPKRHLCDRRGMHDVVVAVRDQGGVLRIATHEDAIRWEKIVRNHVFKLPDVKEDLRAKKSSGPSSRARHSGADYRDIKIHGRMIREHDGYWVGGRMEWIIQCLQDYLCGIVGTSHTHHDVYELTRFWHDILPVLFSHRKWETKESAEYARIEQYWMDIVEARNRIY